LVAVPGVVMKAFLRGDTVPLQLGNAGLDMPVIEQQGRGSALELKTLLGLSSEYSEGCKRSALLKLASNFRVERNFLCTWSLR
jgi:hypothetical protein